MSTTYTLDTATSRANPTPAPMKRLTVPAIRRAKGGTPLMQVAQTIGIDLPLKALVWQDEAGTTFLSYNDPAYLTQRHGLSESTNPLVEAMSGAVKAIAAKATMTPE